MKDSVILGTGTSKLLKSGNVPNNFADFRTALLNGTLPVDITTDSAGYSQVGTALNKANLLSDQAAIDVWNNTNVPSNPVLSDAFQKLADRGSTLETNVSAIQTLLGDTAMTSDMGTVSDSVFRHEREISGWILSLPETNIDLWPQNNIYGTFWINLQAAGGGTLPGASGQGLLFCKRQSTTLWRQTFIGVASASAHKVRYYNTSTGTWTAWTNWSSETIAITPNSFSWIGTTHQIRLHRNGNVVQCVLNFNLSGSMPVSTFHTLGTISAEMRPIYTFNVAVPILNNADHPSVLVTIDADNGNVQVYAYPQATNTAGWLRLNTSWLI